MAVRADMHEGPLVIRQAQAEGVAVPAVDKPQRLDGDAIPVADGGPIGAHVSTPAG
ncbi:hypothetical protein OG226_49665 [Streptomyces sp. NBC_01261]|nr:hypothetical protein [Streptomyces sp. NBC_01261]